MASKHYHIKFNFDHDKEVINRIESKENKNDYIRVLVLSDISADILRNAIKLDDSQPIVISKMDPDELWHIAREEFYNAHCKAVNCDADPNCCERCSYNDYNDLGSDRSICTIEERFDSFWRDYKRIWNRVYGKAVQNGKVV